MMLQRTVHPIHLQMVCMSILLGGEQMNNKTIHTTVCLEVSQRNDW